MVTTNWITSTLTFLALISLIIAAEDGESRKNKEKNGHIRVTRSIASIARLILGGNNVPPDHPLVRYSVDPHTAQSQGGTPSGSQHIGNGVLAAVPAHSSFRQQSPYQQQQPQQNYNNNNGPPQFGSNNNGGGQNYPQPHFRPGPPYYNAGSGGNSWHSQASNNQFQQQQQQHPFPSNNNFGSSPPLQATNYQQQQQQPLQQNAFFNNGNNQNRYNQPPASFLNNYSPPPTIPYNNNNLYQPQSPSNYPQNNYNNNNNYQTNSYNNNYNPTKNLGRPSSYSPQKNSEIDFVGKVTSILKGFLLSPSPKSRANRTSGKGGGSRQ